MSAVPVNFPSNFNISQFVPLHISLSFSHVLLFSLSVAQFIPFTLTLRKCHTQFAARLVLFWLQTESQFTPTTAGALGQGQNVHTSTHMQRKRQATKTLWHAQQQPKPQLLTAAKSRPGSMAGINCRGGGTGKLQNALKIN